MVMENQLATSIDESFPISNRDLALAAGAGTDFFTINFARLASASISVSSDGQRTFNNNLSNAPRFVCADGRLQFGFGDEHLFKHAAVQLFEYEHLVLASALAEFFGEDYTAAIFSALADEFENDDRPKPQLSAFRGFVRAINGMLSFGNFALLADDRIRLNPFKDHDRDKLHSNASDEFVPPKKVVTALQMLSQVKNGQIKNLTIFGGDMLGWFSVYAEMFMGISTVLVQQDGRELYKGDTQAHPAQVKLMFVPSGAKTTLNHDSTTLSLRQPIDPDMKHPFVPPKSTGRITWETLFSKTFGKAWHVLDQTEARTFGGCLGGAARMWEIMASRDDVDPRLMSIENKLDTGSHGIGLIQTWTNWFPELRHLQGRMERGLKLDLDGAGRLCMEGVQHLERLCGCYFCSETQGSEENPRNLPVDGFCIPTIMETILMFGLSLSRVVLVADLYPSRAGVLANYNAQAQKRLQIKRENATGVDRSFILFNQDWNASAPQKLRNIVAMFSGTRSTEELPDNLMAYSHEGITAYIMRLQRGDSGRARDDDNTIRVVIGPINWKNTVFYKLCLGPIRPPAGLLDGWESFACDHFRQRMYAK